MNVVALTKDSLGHHATDDGDTERRSVKLIRQDGFA